MNKKSILLFKILIFISCLNSFYPLAWAEESNSPNVVNINTASLTELTYLPGVGPVTAERIIKARTNRKFEQPHQIMRVKGIARKTFLKLKPYIVVKGDTTATGKIKIKLKE